MTVIYFLYLFAFIEMLPPSDLGWVVPKWQGNDRTRQAPPCPQTGLTGRAAGTHPQHRNPPTALQDPQEGGEEIRRGAFQLTRKGNLKSESGSCQSLCSTGNEVLYKPFSFSLSLPFYCFFWGLLQ